MPRNSYSQTTVAESGRLLFISGQGPVDENGDLVGTNIADQTRQVFRNLERALGAYGSGWEDVLKLGIFLTDIADFQGFTAVREEFLKSVLPASTLVADIALVVPKWKIEVEAVAALP